MDCKNTFRKIFAYWMWVLMTLSFSSLGLAVIPDPAPDGGCSSWAYLDSLGGIGKSEPVMQNWNGRYIIAVQGTDDWVWAKEWNNGTLIDWYKINGGMTSGKPKLVIENNSLQIYVTGKNDYIIYRSKYLSQGQWSAWENLGVPAGDFGKAGPTVSNGLRVYQVLTNQSVKIGECVIPYSPEWTKDLIIYEAITKEFTSPFGPQTGNFNSLKEKIPYMAQLGITGLWVNGFSWSHPTFYNNFWNQYACIRPDVIDPSLGTEQEFKDFIQAAHNSGIKVFVDVVDHGVVPDNFPADPNFGRLGDSSFENPLIGQHPTWFRSDENPWRWYRSDHACLWGMKDYDWVGDQPELENWWVNTWEKYATNDGVDGYRIDLGSMREDLWARIKENCKNQGHPIVVFEEGYASNLDFGRLHGVFDFVEIGADMVGDLDRFGNPWAGDSSRPVITDIESIKSGGSRSYRFETVIMSSEDLSHYGSYDDTIYNGSPSSRYKFGYGMMFTPLIPLFIAGEEFKNPYTPVPALIPSSVHAVMVSMLQWDYLNRSDNAAVFTDVKKIISIRKNDPALNYFAPSLAQANVISVYNYTSNLNVPKPYVRWLGNEAVVIIGNSDKLTDLAINLNLKETLKTINFTEEAYYSVEDLWTGDTQILRGSELNNFNISVATDNFRIFKITPSAFSCLDECYSSQMRCFGSAYQTCGSYDDDSCAEWSASQNCPAAQTCLNGSCITNLICAPNLVNGCRVCKPDGSDWVDDSSKCPGGKVCQSGQCVDICSTSIRISLGGYLTSDPSILAYGDRLIIAGVGGDQAMWACEPVTGQSWYSLEGHLTSGIRMALENGTLRAYGLGGDGYVWNRIYQKEGIWTNWTRTDSTYLGTPGPDTVTIEGASYKVSRNPDLTGELDKCIFQPCAPNAVEGCKVCKNDGSGWVDDNFKCSGNQACRNGQCVASCNNECPNAGGGKCSGTSSYQLCGSYDEDTCLEWSDALNCSSDWICLNGTCITETTTSSTTSSTTMPVCTMPGNGPPCDEVSLIEIVSGINQWAAGSFDLGDVIDLINSWADSLRYPPQ
jgi:hypothetical protein